MKKPPASIITVVDSDELLRTATKKLLQSLGFVVGVFSRADDLLNSGILSQTACLLLDVRMPDMSGLELQGLLAAAGFRTPIVFMAASPDAATRAQALQAGAVEFLHKPAGEMVLLSALWAALQRNDCGERAPAPVGAA
jgi:FixJ family two-component response regulator